MTLLAAMVLYLSVGCGEWYLALRRTLACARGEKIALVSIVFFENLLGLWVLSNFARTNNWLLALSYSAGGSAGALIVAMNSGERPAETSHASASRSSQRLRTSVRAFTPGTSDRLVRGQKHHHRPFLRPAFRCLEYLDSH